MSTSVLMIRGTGVGGGFVEFILLRRARNPGVYIEMSPSSPHSTTCLLTSGRIEKVCSPLTSLQLLPRLCESGLRFSIGTLGRSGVFTGSGSSLDNLRNVVADLTRRIDNFCRGYLKDETLYHTSTNNLPVEQILFVLG
jgi:hypothetical protein